MLILHNGQLTEKPRADSIVVIFGVGLIGAHLVRNLCQHQYSIAQTLPFSWQNVKQQMKEKADIRYCIRSFMKSSEHNDGRRRGGLYALPFRAGINPAPTKPGFLGNDRTIDEVPETTPDAAKNSEDVYCRIDFVWSAGKGGFGMAQRDARRELEVFSEALEMAIGAHRENPFNLVRFHMISSAGALFEGQRNVNAESLPAPKRPYAYLKLAQEKILDECDGLVRFIYRPTSVYGFAGLNSRLGLIPTLLWNGAKNKVSTIFGAPETLRDYVWADDLGAYISGMISSKASCPGRFVLASGKPSALFEILNRIEKVLNKKLFCHYIKSGGNAEHNTFSMKTRPAGWNPLDLETGIRKTHNFMFSDFDSAQYIYAVDRIHEG
jgi:nucleoside-diphosphate-sugar epimerase